LIINAGNKYSVRTRGTSEPTRAKKPRIPLWYSLIETKRSNMELMKARGPPKTRNIKKYTIIEGTKKT